MTIVKFYSSEQGSCKPRPPCNNKTGDSEDLSLPKLKRDLLQTVGNRDTHRFQHHLTGIGLYFWNLIIQITINHHSNHRVTGQLVNRFCTHISSIAQYCETYDMLERVHC